METSNLVSTVLEAAEAVRSAYRQFHGQVTDTLVTKVLLGTFGCLPACDLYFISGFKSLGHKYSYLNRRFVERLLEFCRSNLSQLRNEQSRIMNRTGAHYPIMKLVDMYFWQTGYELAVGAPDELLAESASM